MNSRQARWLEFICEFDFVIKHLKGKEEKDVDALNRRMHVMHVSTISTCKSNLKSITFKALISDGYYLQVKEM